MDDTRAAQHANQNATPAAPPAPVVAAPPIMRGKMAIEAVAKLRDAVAALLSGKVVEPADAPAPVPQPVGGVVTGSQAADKVAADKAAAEKAAAPVPGAIGNLTEVVVGEVYDFGLAFDVFDPQSGLVLTAARPHRSDSGREPVMRTPADIAHSIISARQQQARLQ
jgi:hypothetical protein